MANYQKTGEALVLALSCAYHFQRRHSARKLDIEIRAMALGE